MGKFRNGAEIYEVGYFSGQSEVLSGTFEFVRITFNSAVGFTFDLTG